MCITSTSYAVSVGDSTTKTTSSDVLTSCGTIYGCDIEDSDATTTLASTTSYTTTSAAQITWEEWDDDETDADFSSAGEIAQSKIDSVFGTSNATSTTTKATTKTSATGTTTSAATTTECDAASITYVDGSDDQDMNSCMCHDGTQWASFSTDQEQDAIATFCNGTSTLTTNNTGQLSDDIAYDGDLTVDVSVWWLPNQTNCANAQQDLVMGDYCKTALGRFAGVCDSGDGTKGGVYVDDSAYGCVVWAIRGFLDNGTVSATASLHLSTVTVGSLVSTVPVLATEEAESTVTATVVPVEATSDGDTTQTVTATVVPVEATSGTGNTTLTEIETVVPIEATTGDDTSTQTVTVVPVATTA